MSILKFDSVSKSFGEGAHRTDVLKGIDLEVQEGEFLVLLGFSGTGKTTLINLLAGLDQPSAGSVTFKGAPVTGPGPERGVIFQSYSLMPWLTVTGNVGLAVDTVFPGLSRTERAEKVAHYVELVGLSHAATRRPAELSGGMRQRVNVARALAMN
ncbi:MAG: ATP-binding cassette domain-containing protein, partial [Pseudomonadota bacterium]